MAQSALVTLGARAAGVLLAALAGFCGSGCDGGALVNLGSSELSLGGGGAGGTAGASAAQLWRLEPDPVVAEVEGLQLANPTLTDDAQQLYFSSQQRQQPNETHINFAPATGTGFGAPVPVQLGNLKTTYDASSPAIAPGGDELWLGMSSATGDTDIWLSTGSGAVWSTPSAVVELNSPFDDVPRPPAVNGTLMPLSSKRHGGIRYQIYLATRPRADAPWGEPSNALLDSVDSGSFQSADGFLTDTGLELYFSSTRRNNADSDLYVARRSALDAHFGEPELLTDLQTDFEERMPWLSPDGKVLYFTSNRSGQYALYRADSVTP